MKVTYQADDGYVGKSRPLYVDVDDSDIQECNTMEEVIQLIEEVVQEDFELRVTPCLTDYDHVREKASEIFNQE